MSNTRQASAPRPPGPDPLGLRVAPRVAIDAAVEVHAAGQPGTLPAQLRDLSIGGACIATSSRIDPTRITRVVINFPAGPMTFDARGQWQRDDPNQEQVYTGIAFDLLDSTMEDRLWHMVLDHGRNLAHFLHRHSALGELGVEEAISLSQSSRRREISAGSAIYRQGQETAGEDSIFILMEGSVTLEVRVRGVRNVPYARLGPGDLFGGHPLIARLPNPDSAICETDCAFLEIDAESFRYLRMSKPWTALQLASAVLRVSARRLGQLIGSVTDTR